METKENNSFIGTRYPNCFDTSCVKMNIFEWLQLMRDEKYKPIIEEIRKYASEGNEKVANQIKTSKLPALVCAGYAPEGRKKDSPIFLSKVMMIDYDNHNHEWFVKAKKRLLEANIPGILGIHETPKSGMRTFVHIPIENVTDFPLYEQVVYNVVDKVVEFEHDEQASTLMHLTTASYDPDVWIADPEKLQPFPIQDELNKNAQRLIGDLFQQAAENNESADNNTDTEVDKEFKMARKPLETKYKGKDLQNKIRKLVDHFNQDICAIVPGNRNHALLRLGGYMRYKGMKAKDIKNLIDYVYQIVGCKEYTPKRISQCICWGFEHQANSEKELEVARQKNQQDNQRKKTLNSALEETASEKKQPTLIQTISEEEAQNPTRYYNNVVRNSCPNIPDEVYQKLPKYILDLVEMDENKYVRDSSFIGVMTALSAAMPNLVVDVRGREYSTNLFSLCIAPPGTGKSVIERSSCLLKYINKHFEEKNKKKMDEYEKKKFVWENEIKLSQKENRQFNWNLHPGTRPEPYNFITEGQTSRSRIIANLSKNEHGSYIQTSELNTLCESIRSDCGKFASELRAINMNEHIGVDYKDENCQYSTDFPKLSLLGAGTLSQYRDFIGIENTGMESRAYTYLLPGTDEWIPWAGFKGKDIKEIEKTYDRAAKELYNIFTFLEKSPTEVNIPEKYKEACDSPCSANLNLLHEENYWDLDSIVTRLPILVARYCSILCGIRKAQTGNTDTKVDVTKDDMDVALPTALTILRHTCTAASMLQDFHHKSANVHTVFREQAIYNALPSRFTTADYLNLSTSLTNYSERTLKRRIQEWIKKGMIKREKFGNYVKTNKDEHKNENDNNKDAKV